MTSDADNPLPGVTPELLERYLAARCTPDESLLVAQWLLANPQYAPRVSAVRYVFTNQIPPADANAMDRLWHAVRDRIASDNADAGTPRTLPTQTQRPHRRSITHWGPTSALVAGIAAAAAIALAIGLAGPRERKGESGALVEHRYATGAGQRAAVRLTDGTRVTMAPHTTLIVAGAFGAQERAVSLTGEAQFEVPANARAPFWVRTNGVVTRVLGTTFSVRRYEHDPFAQVSVSTGRVAIEGRGSSITLSAGMTGRATDSTATAIAPATENGTFTDWTLGRVTYRGVPVPAMLASLGRWLGYDFQLADSTLVTRHITATFNVTGRAETIELLQHLLGVSVTIDGDIVTLHPIRKAEGTILPQHNTNDQKSLSTTTEVGR